jgi:pimeloyl-ACP methyl ester carboxylesterase
MPTCDLGQGAQLNYEVHGPEDGPAVLLFNGAFSNLGMWAQTIPVLAAAGVRCIAHDCRAVGESTPTPKEVAGSEQFTFDQYADDAAVLLDALGVESAISWGVAWGSRPAVVFGIRHPSRCNGVVMQDMSVGVSAGEGWRLAQTMGGVMAADKMKRLGIVEPEVAPFSAHANRKLASMAMHATSKAPYDEPESFLEELDKLTVENVLVATGEFDPNLVADPGGSYDVVARLQPRLPRAELIILENTGHGSVAQRPTLCARSERPAPLDRVTTVPSLLCPCGACSAYCSGAMRALTAPHVL